VFGAFAVCVPECLIAASASAAASPLCLPVLVDIVIMLGRLRCGGLWVTGVELGIS
jgi:hypothetical protein